MKRKLLFLSLGLISVWQVQSQPAGSVYASRIHTAIIIDGQLNEPAWQKTMPKSLDYFYGVEQPSDRQQTEVKLLWDDENVYISFYCKDKYLTARERTRNGKTFFDDCAEVFITPASGIGRMHFGFEVNLYKTPNDFIYVSQFIDGKSGVVKSYNPAYELGVYYQGTLNNNEDVDMGWSMEMALPLQLFHNPKTFVKAEIGAKWTVMIVRQDRNEVSGTRRTSSVMFPLEDSVANIHTPSNFGWLKFVE
ncbi:carbohydrate-binding family 9-like protein [Reichenbachiella carrageenanivorans]|uniref:Carbohydrate-binding family 9-like protein n=1 Tax=Reichenbachiella carrageenanivorans TaxID=2979869 RepID=A0ABY6CYR0_9BACT|nr:carbohydrate-binding family 9-like protein [Reichenbachiella carrageenanivorans]UXX79064.1 carbohydrate-binding family 9-like protein [Reichenbachiella carrageenanivorans]